MSHSGRRIAGSLRVRALRGLIFSTGLVALTLATGAQSNAPGVTRGDAEAVFNAFGGGGWSVRLHSKTLEGAPSDFWLDSRTRIVPFLYNDLHYCALDWHVITLALIDGSFPGESFSNQEIFARLAQFHTVFTLDGSTLVTQRKSPKPWLDTSKRLYYVNEGRIMSPEDLTVGQHTLQSTLFDVELGPVDTITITFVIDPPGSGTCLSSDEAFRFRQAP